MGRLFGVGAVFKRSSDGFFYVKKVVVGGPADKAGVQIGARVMSMDNERLYNKTADQLFKIVLGSEGTTLKLALQPPGAGVRTPEQVVVVRRAFIDESFLNAAAIEPLPKGEAAQGGGAWAAHQQMVAASRARGGIASSGSEGVNMDTDKVGIGVTFKKDSEGYYMVKRVSERGGAFASGLASGDRVLSIDGHSMHRKSSQELSRSVLGPAGTCVTLVVRSEDGTVRTIEVKRLRDQPATDADFAADNAPPRKLDESVDSEWEGGATGADGTEWDGQGQVMRLEGRGDEVGIGATLVRESRGLFVVAEVSPPPPGELHGRLHELLVGDIIVQVDGIQVPACPFLPALLRHSRP